MTLFVAGLSHKNAPVELREQLAVEEDKLRELLRDVAATGAVQETLILSTCNRVEVYGVAEAPGEARAVVFRHLCRHRGLSHASIEPLLYTHVDDDAVRHAFRVAASLDSMLIGEPQLLGQVKDAFALAQACETVGPALHTLFTQAFAVGKRVRSETEIARHAVSVSFAAVELAKKIFAGLGGRAVLLEVRVEQRLDERRAHAPVLAEVAEREGARLTRGGSDAVHLHAVAGREDERLLDRARGGDVAQELAELVLLHGEPLAQLHGCVPVGEAGDEERHQEPCRPGRNNPAPSVRTSAAKPTIAK